MQAEKIEELVWDLSLLPSLRTLGNLQSSRSLSLKVESQTELVVLVSDSGCIFVFSFADDFLTIDQLSKVHQNINQPELKQELRAISEFVPESVETIHWVHKSERGEYKIFPFSLVSKI